MGAHSCFYLYTLASDASHSSASVTDHCRWIILETGRSTMMAPTQEKAISEGEGVSLGHLLLLTVLLLLPVVCNLNDCIEGVLDPVINNRVHGNCNGIFGQRLKI